MVSLRVPLHVYICACVREIYIYVYLGPLAVSEVGDDYKVGTPEDWKWPPGRIDHWGVSQKDVARTSAAERVLRFKA